MKLYLLLAVSAALIALSPFTLLLSWRRLRLSSAPPLKPMSRFPRARSRFSICASSTGPGPRRPMMRRYYSTERLSAEF